MSLPSSFMPKFLARESAAIESYHENFAKSACQSPIEAVFLTALYSVSRGLSGGLTYGPLRDGEAGIYVLIQEPVGPYRADFLIGRAGRDQRIVVECDGHEFHERTKEQAERDRRRDREMQQMGHQVFRFTGREIYRDAIACAAEVVGALIDIDRGQI